MGWIGIEGHPYIIPPERAADFWLVSLCKRI